MGVKLEGAEKSNGNGNTRRGVVSIFILPPPSTFIVARFSPDPMPFQAPEGQFFRQDFQFPLGPSRNHTIGDT